MMLTASSIYLRSVWKNKYELKKDSQITFIHCIILILGWRNETWPAANNRQDKKQKSAGFKYDSE